MLNVEPSFVHHYRAYGAWSDAVKDYTEQGIMDWMGTPQFRALMKIEEPYEYRDRLTMPKLMLNASGDQFFLPDSSQFYFDDLKGEKHVRYVPNAGALPSRRPTRSRRCRRSMRPSSRARRGPSSSGRSRRTASIKVVTKQTADHVQLWQATNPNARNFRLDVIGPAYTNTPLQPTGPNTWVGKVPTPADGMDGVLRRDDVPGDREVPVEGDERHPGAARQAALRRARSRSVRGSAEVR